MTQYKTYQEAKIANPDSEIYYSAARRLGDKGFFSTRENAEGFFHRCKPEDYCVSLESFLASGKRLVRGDAYIGTSGIVSIVGDCIAESAANEPHSSDSSRYILKTKALEAPAYEWVNGDECVHADRPSCVCTYIGKNPYVNGHFVLSKNGSVRYINDNCLRKPEIPEQKLERKRLESAYHLACIAGAVDKWGGEFTFDDFKLDGNAVKQWLAVVDETKYLRAKND